jgi:hypothetical protein
VNLSQALLTSEIMDQVLIDLDVHNLSNGSVSISPQRLSPGHYLVNELTTASLTAYTNLKAKGWNIDASEPPQPNTQYITMTTTASNAAWRLYRVFNSGQTLHWEATNSAIGTLIADEDDPTFDFSANTNNDPIFITIRSGEGFNGLKRLNLYNIAENANSEITNINIHAAKNLLDIAPFNSALTSLDVSQNLILERILIHGSPQMQNQVLNTSNNPLLNSVLIVDSGIIGVDFSSNPLMILADLRLANLSSAVLDQVLIDLDNHGLSNGEITMTSQQSGGQLTVASLVAYNSLISKGWTIDVPAPAAILGVEINVTGLGNMISGDGSNVVSTTDNTDFGSDLIITPITKSFTIQNLGDTSLDLTNPSPYISITGANPADFTVSAIPTTPVASGTSTTFEVTFDAATAGLKTAIINIANNDLDEALYTINIQAEAIALAPGPEINIVGNGVSIPSGNTPAVADDTDFGQVALGSSVTKIFTIQNVGDSPLTITGAFGVVPPPYQITVSPISPVLSGGSTTLEVTYTPSNVGANQNVQVVIINNDATGGENPFLLNLTAEGIPASSGAIAVLGNSIPISNPDFSPDLADGTDFGQETIGITKTNIFTIQNNGVDDLTITGINLTDIPIPPAKFAITGLPSFPLTIVPGNSFDFTVEFTPPSEGVFNQGIEILNSDLGENPYVFAITGQGIIAAISNDIMITQYFEGITDSKWIEIKNISGSTIPGGTYFLALYDEAALPNIATLPPTASESIPAMANGEVLLFKNVLLPAVPSAANLGSATQIVSSVCNFDGNDVILISTSVDVTCYANRQDIIGDIGVSAWGPDRSYIRGGCSSEAPALDFDQNDWIELSISTDVNVANTNTNIALGTQAIGTTIWNGATWTNLQPDKTRSVQLSGNYSAADGSFDACNLIIDTGAFLNLDGGTTNTVAVEKNLTINGSFTVGDTESLVTYDPSSTAITGVITKKESSTSRSNEHDVTYWSSPINNGNIGTNFPGVTPSRIWSYNQALTTVSDPNDPAIYNAWVVASGPMARAKGYAAEGSTGTTGVHDIEFTGTPNNGPQSIEIFVNVDSDRDNDFNLIGNPYPSAINAQNFFDANSNVDKVIYLWTHATAISGGTGGDFAFNDYATLNLTGGTTVDGVPPGGTGVGGGPVPTNNIGSSQGFMVRGLTNGFAVFNNGMRIKNANNQFFKQSNTKNKADVSAKEQLDRIWLNLTTDQGGFNQLLVGFMEKATEGFDDGYDALKIGQDNAVVFYSVLGDEKYAIQGLSPFTEDKSIALGFDANVAPRTFKVSVDHMEGALTNAEIFLTDNLLGKVHDLKQGDYEFEVTEVGENKNRFTLQFKGAVLGVDDIVTKQDFIISNQTGALRINSKQTVKSLRVFDVLGRLLIQQKPNQQIFDISTGSIKNGTVLIVEATLENGASVNRKTIAF